MITGTTKLIAHLGYPTESFKAPMIYNPYFEKHGIDVVVVPMGCRSEDFPSFVRLVFRLSNIQGALITMPHKITTVGLLDEVMTTARVAGSCNAVRVDRATAGSSATCSTAKASSAASCARAARSRAPAPSSSARAASARRSPPRSRRPASRASRSSTPAPPRWRASPAACAPPIRRSRSRPVRTTRPASTSWSTRRPSA